MNGAVVVGLLAIASPAWAQPGMTPPAPPVAPAAPLAEPAPRPSPRPSGEPLSENVALGLSLGGTLVSWAMVLGASEIDSSDSSDAVAAIGVAGVMLAPSFGHWYAGTIATRGLGLRAVGVGSAFVGALMALSACPIFATDDECEETVAGPALMILGAGLFVGGTIDDIATAPGRVRAHNARFENLALVPSIRRDGGGFAVAGTF